MINNINLVGNLTRDVEVKYFNNGKPFVVMGIANNRRYKSENETIDKPLFVDIKIIGEMANICKKYLTKGSKVGVTGRLDMDIWEDENGNKKQKLFIFAEKIFFLDKKMEEQQNEVSISSEHETTQETQEAIEVQMPL